MKKAIALLMTAVMALVTPASVLAEEWDDIVISEETAEPVSEENDIGYFLEEDTFDSQDESLDNGSEFMENDTLAGIVIESVEEIGSDSKTESDEKENELEATKVLADGTCGEKLSWFLDSDGTLTISGSGAITDYELVSSRWENCGDEIIHVIIEEGVTAIGSYAFYDCAHLTDVVIPESVTAIGAAAFMDCSSLEDAVIPDTVTELANDAFEGCTVLRMREDGEPESNAETEATIKEPESEAETEAAIEEPESEAETEDIIEKSESEEEIKDTVEEQTSKEETEVDATDESESGMEIDTAAQLDPVSDLILEEYSEGEEEDNCPADGYELETSEEDKGEDPDEDEEDTYGINTLSVVSSGNCGSSATWSLSDTGVLTISGSGATEDYSSSSRPEWESSKSSIVSVVIESGITKIGDWTFYNHSNIQSVSIASSVTSFGRGVFAGCSSLTSATLPTGVTEVPYAMFGDCISLTSFSAPGAVSYGDYAFQSVAMDTFTVGKNVTDISYLAFYDASIGSFAVESGNSVYSASSGVLFTDGGETLMKYPAGSAAASYTVPSKATKINAGAFLSCENLQQISLGSVTSLGESAFQNCGLTSLTIPDSVTEADSYTFYGCKSLNSVKFGTGLNETSYEMFEECTALTTIDFGTVLKSLGARTFAYCSSLTEVALPSNVTSIENGSFGECRYLVSFSCEALEEIPYQAFLNDKSLSAVVLGEGLTAIYRYAFGGCTALLRVVLPSTVTFVHADAFESCTELIQTDTSMSHFGNNGLRNTETITVSGEMNYTNAYEVLDIVNRRREEDGLSSLVMDTSLLETAMQRAAEISILFSHTRPDGSSCFYLNSAMYAENIASGSTSAESVMEGWMNSSGHKANILNSSYSTIGIGCFITDGAYYWVQCFGQENNSSSCSQSADQSGSFSIQIATETFDEASTTSGIIWGSVESYTYNLVTKLSNSNININGTTEAKAYLQNPGNSALTKIGGIKDFSSSDDSVATVSNGTVTGLKTGTTDISTSTQKGYYTGKATLTVSGENISQMSVSLSASSYTYDGSAKKPTVTVKNGSTALTSGTDYTVSYSNNTNAGTATVTVTGKGNYTGTVTKNFTINKASQTVTAKAAASSIEVGKTTTITASGKGTISYSSSNTSVATVNSSGVVTGKAVGTATITVKAAGNSNYNSASTTVEIKVVLKIGSSYRSGDFVYKILTLPSSGKGTVSLISPAKSSIKKAAIPAKVTIGGRVFKVTEIGAKAFKGCKKLTTVSTGKNVTVIGNQAFQGCTSMTGVSIQVSTTTIGKKAFYNCQSLKKIVIKSKQLTSVGKNVLKGIKSNATIKVPSSKLSAYKKLLKNKGQGSKVKITS